MSKLTIYGGTDRGMVRKQNEDSIGYVQFDHSPVSLAVVADGVGGHAGGEVASRMAVDAIEEFVRKAVLQANSGVGYVDNWLEQTLVNAIEYANKKIIDHQLKNQPLANMATTVVALLIKENQLVLSHLGDSRCYRRRNNQLELLSHDHTLAQQMVDNGVIDEKQMRNSPYHHVLNRALGLENTVCASACHHELYASDFYLLCSDGLTNCLDDEQISAILKNNSDMHACIEELIASANDVGGVDNISVVIVQAY